jgi:hypothetical protein
MWRKLYDKLASLDLGIWLISGLLLLLAIGSFGSGASEAGSINDLPLFLWLREAPLSASWWLWCGIALIALLALNTVICSIDSIRSKFGRDNFLIIIAPQVMHLGFLLIILAHLFSAWGGQKEVMQVYEGSSIGSPDGNMVRVGAITASVGPMGMMTEYGAEFFYDEGGSRKSQRVRPNHPLFYRGFGIYVKDVAMMPAPTALVEIHREPGAGVALAGALMFTIGNVVLLFVRRGK